MPSASRSKKSTKTDIKSETITEILEEKDVPELANPLPIKNDNTYNFQKNSKCNVKLMNLISSLTDQLKKNEEANNEVCNVYKLLSNFSTEKIKELDDTLRIKEEEIEEKRLRLLKNYEENEYKSKVDYDKKCYELNLLYQKKKDELENDFKKIEISKIESYITKYNKVLVNNDEYNKLNKDLQKLTKEYDTFEEKICKEYEEKCQKELDHHIKTKDLETQVKTAEMKATIEQQIKEIATLTNTITILKDEIAQQRTLTKNVAEAGQKSVTQNFTK